MMLWQIGRLRRRRNRRDLDIAQALEQSLQQNNRLESLSLIEAAMRHLHAVTVGQLREKPSVLAVRVGAYGFEVLLEQPAIAPEGWVSVSGGYVLELAEGVTMKDLEAYGNEPSLCPALVPVGDTMEGPLLLNLERIKCLTVSGPADHSENFLSAVIALLSASPLANDVRIMAIGVNVPDYAIDTQRVHSVGPLSFELEELLSKAHTSDNGTSKNILVIGPDNDLLIQRAGQIAAAQETNLSLLAATSSVTARWPWRIHIDATSTAVVHPIACTMLAAQITSPEFTPITHDITMQHSHNT